jgi:hypothetical protein
MKAMSIRLFHKLVGSNRGRTLNDHPASCTKLYFTLVHTAKFKRVVGFESNQPRRSRHGLQQTLRPRDGARAGKPCQWVSGSTSGRLSASGWLGVAPPGLSVPSDSATAAAHVLLDGQGHLVIEARSASADLNCWYERCEYGSGKVTTETSSYELHRAVPPSDTTGAGVAEWTCPHSNRWKAP